jgi:outer membrane protein assembly factor BamB
VWGEYRLDVVTMPQTNEPTPRKPLRLWPGVLLVTLQLLLRFALPVVWPDGLMYSVLGGIGGGAAIVLWWLFFSRAPWVERLGAIFLMVVALGLARRILDPSIATGAMGILYFMYAIPPLCLAFVVWAVATRNLSDGTRRVTMVATILLACSAWALVRTNGFNAEFSSDLAWRWAKTSEERLLANDTPLAPPAPVAVKTPEPAAIASTPAAAKTLAEPIVARVHEPVPVKAAVLTRTGPDWPGFRGPHRDGIASGVRIETDWSKLPPVEMWRRPIGPGWSSFAVQGDLLYTQEQRGSDEVVACYNVATGKPVWRHTDAARFWESNAGPGPRGTPTLSNGRVYTFGATGLANALDAGTGAVVWSRNAASDTGMKVPEWGFASSPLVVDDQVIVAASGRLAAYNLATGEPRWLGPAGGVSYSSPVLAKIGGVEQILLLNTAGVTSVSLSNGTLLWKYEWPGYPIVQPALTLDGDVLISVSDSSGTRRLAVTHGTGGWTVEERWTSMGLKPYFNDFVLHNGYAYGFDGGILACIDLKDGKRAWKGGRYGHGQLVLLPDSEALLVLSEEGGLALVAATADQFKELAHFPAIEGKTWNHPVLVGDVLLVRNGQEMVAFRLSLVRS